MLIGRGSVELQQLADRVMPGGFTSFFRRLQTPIVVGRAKGARIWDVEGREYLDYHNGAGPTILGHCNDRVTDSAFEALGHLDIVGAGNTWREIRLAEKLVAHIPSAEVALLCNGGSDATFQAVRLSRAVTGKTEIMRIDGSYHGWHDYLLAAPAGSAWQKSGVLADAIKHTWVVPMNDMDAIADVVKKADNQIAGIFIEPLMHNAGYIPPEPGYFEDLRRFCTEKGIILTFDEIITGFRHHLGGYQAICGVTPDLTTVSKAMANGYPIGAICGRRDLMMHFNTAPGGNVFYGGTFNGHTGPCAAALATISQLEDGDVYRHIYMLGDRMRSGLNEIIQRLGMDGFATGYGSVWVLYFKKESPVRKYADVTGPDYHVEQDQRFRALMLEKGFWLVQVPRKRAYICAAHVVEDIDRTLDVAETVLRQVKNETAP